MGDVLTVFWKEWKEVLLQTGTVRGGLIRFGLLVGVTGVVMPVQVGPNWAASPAALVNAMWLPLVLVMTLSVDLVAGERERHTLETLLASRLPDGAIVLGKLAAVTVYGWAVALAGALLSLVVVNIAYSPSGLQLYSPWQSLAIVVLSLLLAGLSATSGFLASLHARTVRQASQTLSLGLLLGGLALSVVLALGLQAVPAEWRTWLVASARDTGYIGLALFAAVPLALLVAGLLAASLARFRRTRLLLD